MKALARLIVGLVLLDAAVTAPTLESINYDSETYDATLEDLDHLYNYENIPVGRAEVTDSSNSRDFFKRYIRDYWGFFSSDRFLFT